MACKYCDFENAPLPWFATVNDQSGYLQRYDGILVDGDDAMLVLHIEDVEEEGESETETPIYYCPFCGRKLAEKPASEMIVE